MLVHPSHALAHSKEVTLSECARQTVIAHNDPSHVRDRVLRLFEQHHIPANILVSLPSLEGHQARRRDADGRGAAAAALRRVGDRARRARRAGDAGDSAAPSGAAGLPEGRRALARLDGVPRRCSTRRSSRRRRRWRRGVTTRQACVERVLLETPDRLKSGDVRQARRRRRRLRRSGRAAARSCPTRRWRTRRGVRRQSTPRSGSPRPRTCRPSRSMRSSVSRVSLDQIHQRRDVRR